MPIEVVEIYESPKWKYGDDPQAELGFYVIGTSDEIAARDALLAGSPAVYQGLVRKSATLSRQTETSWEGTVTYGRLSQKETGQSTFRFETGGATTRVYQSKATVGSYAPPGKSAPNFQGAVNVQDRRVEGVDIIIPEYTFSETHYRAADAITQAYKITLANLTGKVNNAPFRGFNAGEVLFTGASGSMRSGEDWEITYNFKASPNLSNLTIGDITGIDKRGWEYLWVLYTEVEDGASKTIIKRPRAVYVERVYDEADFSLLGIGN